MLRLFIEAYNTSDALLQTFILRTIKHHIAMAQQAALPIYQDDLLMQALNHDTNLLCARAAAGIGIDVLQALISECEAGGLWWSAAKLCFAVSTHHGMVYLLFCHCPFLPLRPGVTLHCVGSARGWNSSGRGQPWLKCKWNRINHGRSRRAFLASSSSSAMAMHLGLPNIKRCWTEWPR